MNLRRSVIALAAGITLCTFATVSGANAETPKSGVCGSIFVAPTWIGPDYFVSNSELTAGEVLHFTNNDSDARPGFITIRIEYDTETPNETTMPFGGTAEITVLHSGPATLWLITSDDEIQNITGACDAAPDADDDTIGDADDNCPAAANTDQADADGDLVGDACSLAALPDSGAASAELALIAAAVAMMGAIAVLATRRRATA